jgi:hypothetical protein
LFCNEPEATLLGREKSFELVRIQCFYLQHLSDQFKGTRLSLRGSGRIQATQIVVFSFIYKPMNININTSLSEIINKINENSDTYAIYMKIFFNFASGM